MTIVGSPEDRGTQQEGTGIILFVSAPGYLDEEGIGSNAFRLVVVVMVVVVVVVVVVLLLCSFCCC